MLMVDSLYSLAMEVKGPKEDNLKSLIKSAVYSTSHCRAYDVYGII